MRIIGDQKRISLLLIAGVLLLQLSPGLATSQPDAQQATSLGSRPIEVTFTKWPTAQVPQPAPLPMRSLFAGNVGGDLGDGGFVAEVLDRKASTACVFFDRLCAPDVTPPTITESIASLQAIYEVQADEHSFIALIQGGSTSRGGRLNGVIVSGWRIGANVRVAFDRLSSCTDRDGVAHGPCFDGTIRVGRAPEK